MLVKKLKIQNIGIVSNEEIDFNKPLILFYGDIQQGKSTILNCIKMLFGGSFPNDIIKHGEKDGSIKLLLENGSITRSFYYNKNKEIVARPIKFILDGEEVSKPVDEIKKLVNPFLLDQDFLVKKVGAEREKYFVELFGAETPDLDKELKDVVTKAQSLRSEIKGYGEIVVEEIEKPDIEGLKQSLENIKANNIKIESEYENKCKEVIDAIKEKNEKIRKNNTTRDIGLEKIITSEKAIADCEEWIKKYQADMEDHKKNIEKINNWLSDPENAEKKELPLEHGIDEPLYDDTTEIEEKISNAKADEIKYEQYQKDLIRKEEKSEKEDELKDLENRQKEIKKEKIKKLADISEKIKIDGLVFDENGTFRYKETHADMLSTSQLMELSSELSKLYPDGLGIELIDRAESLGKSIFGYVKKAEAESKTILAAIVGEKPANVPENVGVFVVENGNIK